MVLRRQVRKVIAKIKSPKGFSLAELLMATIIMLLATGILTSTITLAVSQYKKANMVSNAQLLCSTLSVYVENELSYATVVETAPNTIKTKSDGAVLFRSESHNFGPDSFFAIAVGTGDSTAYYPVTAAESNNLGRLVQTSDLYTDIYNSKYGVALSQCYYDIASDKLYEDYKTGMDLKYENSSFIAHIRVMNKQDELLAENYLRIIPLGIKE